MFFQPSSLLCRDDNCGSTGSTGHAVLILRLLQTNLRRFAQTAAIAVSDTHTDTLTFPEAIEPPHCHCSRKLSGPYRDANHGSHLKGDRHHSLQGIFKASADYTHLAVASWLNRTAQTARLCHSGPQALYIAFTPLVSKPWSFQDGLRHRACPLSTWHMVESGACCARKIDAGPWTELSTGFQQRSYLLQQHFSYQGTDLQAHQNAFRLEKPHGN